MTNRRGREKSRESALALLRQYGVAAAPVPVEEIARECGITVKMVPLEDGLSGMIFIKDLMPVVVVNSTHPRTRQRFTLAHEIGHHELHMDDIGSQVHVDKKYFVMARDDVSSKGFDLKEIEANRFAAELLVPHSVLIRELRGRVVDVEDEELVTELAKTFQVSRQMMAIRIGELASR